MRFRDLPAGAAFAAVKPPAAPAPALDGATWLLLLALSVLWGASFVLIPVAVADIPVFTLVFLRVALAAATLHAVVWLTGRHHAGKSAWGRYGLMGLLNNAVPFVLIVYATPRIGAGAASILNATAPMFTLVLAHLLTSDEKITRRKIAGIALGFAGVVALIGPAAFSGLIGQLLAALAMLAAAFSYGLSAIVARSFRSFDPVVSAAGQLTASSLLLAPFAVLLESPWQLPAPGAPAIVATLAFALLSTALAYILFFRIVARAGGTNVMLVTLLIPVSALALAALFLRESITAAHLAGMILISAGLLVIDGRLLGRMRRWRA